MKKLRIYPFFYLSLFVAAFQSAFLLNMRLMAFAPFLAIVFTRRQWIPSLWISFLTGLVMDLLSYDYPFGFHGIIYSLATVLVYRYKRFFVEKAVGLASLTILVSLVTTGVQTVMMQILGIQIFFKGSAWVIDFFLMALLDGLYAFLWFSCPLFLYNFIRRRWFRFLFLRKETKRKLEDTVKN